METHHITPARGLSETGLKWIALVTMVLDHIHYFFSFTGCVPEWFSMVGRLGAPLFLFCLVEGFTHTHTRKRYFARVYVLSTAMSLLFFFMAFAHVLVRPDGTVLGTIGGGCMESAVVRRALEMIHDDDHSPILYHGDLTGQDAEDDGMVCGGVVDILMEQV